MQGINGTEGVTGPKGLTGSNGPVGPKVCCVDYTACTTNGGFQMM